MNAMPFGHAMQLPAVFEDQRVLAEKAAGWALPGITHAQAERTKRRPKVGGTSMMMMMMMMMFITISATVRHREMGTGEMGTILRFASVPLRKMGTDLLGSWWASCQCVLPTREKGGFH